MTNDQEEEWDEERVEQVEEEEQVEEIIMEPEKKKKKKKKRKNNWPGVDEILGQRHRFARAGDGDGALGAALAVLAVRDADHGAADLPVDRRMFFF